MPARVGPAARPATWAATGGPSAPSGRPAARAGCSSPTRTSRGRASCASGRSTSPCPASSTSTARKLIGLPGIGIGFTDEFAWTHTVSAGNRFTAYTLDLDPDDPTALPLRRWRQADDVDATTRSRCASRTADHRRATRTLWSSEYGPILDFPGLGWTRRRRRHLPRRQHRQRRVHRAVPRHGPRRRASTSSSTPTRRYQGVPLFNTIAVSHDGRAWYADTVGHAEPAPPRRAAVRRSGWRAIRSPASPRDERRRPARRLGQPVYAVGGRRPAPATPASCRSTRCRWSSAATTSSTPTTASGCPTPREMLEGDYSPLHGAQDTQRSLRTRENATVLSGIGPAERRPVTTGRSPARSCATAALANLAHSARLLREAVVERCSGDDRRRRARADRLRRRRRPARRVASTCAGACTCSPDGTVATTSTAAAPCCGASCWPRARRDVEGGLGALWAEPFDPARPVETPAGSCRRPGRWPPGAGHALARVGADADQGGLRARRAARRRAVRPARRPPHRPHGGYGGDGVTNVIGYSDPSSNE